MVLSSGGGGGGSGIVSKSDIQGLPPNGNQNWPAALQGAAEANALFKGIPQHGLTLGNPKAKVEMEMFIDVQCPLCQDYETNSLPAVVGKYIRTGKVQLHLKPWAFIGGAGSQSFSGRLGLIAASFQNKGFEYAKVLYDNQQTENTGWLTGQEMAAIAASVTGLNLAQWQARHQQLRPEDRSRAGRRRSPRRGTSQGTPTVLVGPPGGKLHDRRTPGLAPTLQQTEQALDAALALAPYAGESAQRARFSCLTSFGPRD